jgi:hypothetical protein
MLPFPEADLFGAMCKFCKRCEVIVLPHNKVKIFWCVTPCVILLWVGSSCMLHFQGLLKNFCCVLTRNPLLQLATSKDADWIVPSKLCILQFKRDIFLFLFSCFSLFLLATLLPEEHILKAYKFHNFWQWRNSPQWARASSLPRLHDHRHITLGRTPLDKWSARSRDLYLTTHNADKRQCFPRRDSKSQSQHINSLR